MGRAGRRRKQNGRTTGTETWPVYLMAAPSALGSQPGPEEGLQKYLLNKLIKAQRGEMTGPESHPQSRLSGLGQNTGVFSLLPGGLCISQHRDLLLPLLTPTLTLPPPSGTAGLCPTPWLWSHSTLTSQGQQGDCQKHKVTLSLILLL